MSNGVELLRDVALAPFIFNLAYDGAARLEFVGIAFPGTLDTQAGWRILRLTYVGATTNIATVRQADGDLNFDNVWDNRATLAYS